MENAIWNGKTLIATDISRDYALEKLIRKASGHKELFCPDSDCNHPVLRYCHGEKKDAYFAHLDNSQCDYAVFDKENTDLMREVKLKIYKSFCARGYSVQMDVKLLDHHYTHLLITLQDKTQIAVELGTQRMTANRMELLTAQYREKGIQIKWLVISNAQGPVKESETFFMKRYQLNESNKKDLLILNWDGTELAQHIADPREYLYKGQCLHSRNYPDIYSEYDSLDSLTIEDGELSINGFHDRFNLWLTRKEKAFNKRIQELTEAEAAAQKHAESLRQQEETRKTSEIDYIQYQKAVWAQRRENAAVERVEQSIPESVPASVIERIDQQEDQVYALGFRWIKCKTCGKIAPTSEFWTYGGPNRMNLGECQKCNRQQKD